MNASTCIHGVIVAASRFLRIHPHWIAGRFRTVPLQWTRALLDAPAPGEEDAATGRFPSSSPEKSSTPAANNILFKACSTKELDELVEVFAPSEASIVSTIIRQGDECDTFYVIERGPIGVYEGDVLINYLS